jgi:hypothetical protein
MHETYDGLPQKPQMPNHDELALVLQLVNAKTQALTDAARTFQDTPRDGVENLELGRPLLRDLRSLASTLEALAEGLHATADHVQRRLIGR